MKKYTGYLILLNCIFLIQSCYTNLSIKEIDQELTNLKSKELELQRIKTEKEDIEKELYNFLGKSSKEKYSSYGILGDKLYLAVERDYDDCIQTIFDRVIFKYNDFMGSLMRMRQRLYSIISFKQDADIVLFL